MLVKLVQLAGNIALVAQHVDQKAQCTQAVANLVEQRALFVFRHVFGLQALHILAHAHHGLGSWLQPQHRQHATHLRQMGGDGAEHGLVVRTAEILVEQLFGFGQRATQFPHHTAHGLLVAHLTIQLLHPGLQRLRCGTCQHRCQTLSQRCCMGGHVLITDVE